MRLKDLKTANRRKVVDVVLNHGPLSRIEISKAAGLSPSTVTGLVSSLLEDGLLIETGNKALTAGRSRTELSVNRNLGVIATLEVGRRSVLLTLFDLMFEPVHSETISRDSLEGNALLVAVCNAVDRALENSSMVGDLLGMGLLYQEGIRTEDCMVMYSTGIQDATISLKDALFTQYKIPIKEEHSQGYTISQVLDEADRDVSNAAVISIGSEVVVSVKADDALVSLKGGATADITPMVCGEAYCDKSDEYEGGCIEFLLSLGEEDRIACVSRAVVSLCSLFSLDRMLIFGPDEIMTDRFVQGIEYVLTAVFGPESPWLEWLRGRQLAPSDVSKTCAADIRRATLLLE